MSVTYIKGKYRARILEQGFTESSTKATPAFYLQLKILKRYGANDELEACPEYERTYLQYLANETSINILRGHLKAIGVSITDMAQLDPEAAGGLRLAGKEIDVECEIEVYNGQQRERWSIPRSRKKLKLDAVRALNDRYGHLLRNGEAAPQPAPPVREPNRSDDPF
jgi:hypothetical protein